MYDPPSPLGSWGCFGGFLCLFFGFLFCVVWCCFDAGLLLDGLNGVWCMMYEFRFGRCLREG